MAERDKAEPLVTRPLDELAGWLCVRPDGGLDTTYSRPSQSLVASVGGREAQVLLSVGELDWGPAIELFLTPADALELAHRLLRMAAAVHDQSSTPRPHV